MVGHADESMREIYTRRAQNNFFNYKFICDFPAFLIYLTCVTEKTYRRLAVKLIKFPSFVGCELFMSYM